MINIYQLTNQTLQKPAITGCKGHIGTFFFLLSGSFVDTSNLITVNLFNVIVPKNKYYALSGFQFEI